MRKQFLRLARRLRNIRPRPDQNENHVAAVALLIDGENISADFAVHLLAHAGKFGGVSFCRVYGNWAASAMRAGEWASRMVGRAARPGQLPFGPPL